MTRPPVVCFPPAVRRWQPELPGCLPVGAWFVGVAGELRCLPNGTVEMRPTPWPSTRPSIAAIPTVRVSR